MRQLRESPSAPPEPVQHRVDHVGVAADWSGTVRSNVSAEAMTVVLTGFTTN